MGELGRRQTRPGRRLCIVLAKGNRQTRPSWPQGTDTLGGRYSLYS